MPVREAPARTGHASLDGGLIVRVFDVRATSFRRPLGRPRTASLTILVVVAAATALIVLWHPPGRPPGRTRPSPERPGSSSLVVYENKAAGYSFVYPRTWDVEGTGTVSTVMSPAEDAVVSFGSHMPSADLLQTARQLTSLVSRSYGAVRMGGPRMEAINSALAVMRRGHATNRSGEDLLFLVAAIHGPTHTFGAVGFSKASTPAALHEAVVDVVRSFRVQP
jgi:hypothetical protein